MNTFTIVVGLYSVSIFLSTLPCVPQLTLLKNLTVANQWALKLPGGESVHHIMTFDPIDRNYLYLMTSHHVRLWDQYFHPSTRLRLIHVLTDNGIGLVCLFDMPFVYAFSWFCLVSSHIFYEKQMLFSIYYKFLNK